MIRAHQAASQKFVFCFIKSELESLSDTEKLSKTTDLIALYDPDYVVELLYSTSD